MRSADLNIIESDIHIRTEMKTFNRALPFYVMSYQKCGEAKLRIGEQTYSIIPGTVVLIPPKVEHDHYKETEEKTTFLWVHFTYGIINILDMMQLFQLPITFQLKNLIEFEKVFIEYIEVTKREDFLSPTLLRKAKAYELLYLLLEGIINPENTSVEYLSSDRFLSMLVQFIRKPEQEISLQNLSEQYHLHPTYISNRFKELFGKSPIHVQRELRIQKAKTLLKTGDLSVTEIAESIGFNSISAFTRLFKTYVGVSPSQYRNLGKKENSNLSSLKEIDRLTR